MISGDPSSRGHWASRFGFILAAVGSAVGLGNIWKFPYVTGENGGGAFVLFYILCVLFIGLPIMFGELIIGRAAQLSPVSAFKALRKGPWWAIGALGVLSGALILSFYSVVAGWTIHFLILAIRGFGRQEAVPELFGHLLADSSLCLLWHTLFIAMTTFVVIGGVQRGIEKASKILMPLLLMILLILMVTALSGRGGMAGVTFLLSPDFSKLSQEAMLIALGHAFFTLSLGMGAMITYGSYLSKEVSIIKSGIVIAAMDTMVAIMAGLVIFPVVFAFDMSPDQGPGLVFKTLPPLFAQMPGGSIIAIAFFLLLLFAALTSSISLLEVVVSYCVDEARMARRKAALGTGAIIWLIGIPSAISSLTLWGWSTLDFLDTLTTNFMLPLGGISISLFVGFGISRKVKEEELAGTPRIILNILEVLLKVITPALATLVLVSKVIDSLEKHPLMAWISIIVFTALIVGVIAAALTRKERALP